MPRARLARVPSRAIAHARGDREARALAVRAATRAPLDVPDLEMLGLALEGSSLVTGGAVQDGMRRLDEATVIAFEDRAQIPISGAWTCCFLVSACLRVYDFERAFAWRTGSPTSPSATAAAGCSPSAAPSTGPCSAGAAAGTRPSALLEARSRTSRARAPPGPPARSPASPSCAAARAAPTRRSPLLDRAGPTRAAQLCRARP